MSEVVKLAEELSKTPAIDVVRKPEVKAQFIHVYNQIWGDGGEGAYERESMYFNRIMRDSKKLRECSGISVYYAFMDLAVKGFSLEQGPQATCYLTPRSIQLGVNEYGKKVYGQVCNLAVSGYGELVLRIRAGQIRHADNPVVVYESDDFQFGEKDGRKFVNYSVNYPRVSNKIIACFMKITRMDGSIDYAMMMEEDWNRLRQYSEKQNTYYDADQKKEVSKPNPLYSSNNQQIDLGFLKAKCIKHAFKNYPKLKIGAGSVLESEAMNSDGNIADDANYYGDMPQDLAPTQAQPQPQPQNFCPEPDMSAGVRFDGTVNSDGTF